MKKIIGAIILIALIAGAAYYFFPNLFGVDSISGTPSTPEEQSYKRFQSDQFGITFDYSNAYDLNETGSSDGSAAHAITLVDREAGAQVPENGEGPTSINVVIIPTTETDVRTWMRNSTGSNIELLGGEIASTTVDGTAAARYMTDGLYATDNVALIHNGRAYVFSVGWITREDKIVSDFEQLLTTVDLH